jgi:hypothetical protein
MQERYQWFWKLAVWVPQTEFANITLFETHRAECKLNGLCIILREIISSYLHQFNMHDKAEDARNDYDHDTFLV